MTGTYVCPNCDGRVLHYCHPPEYFRRRHLPRVPGIRQLRRVPLPDTEQVDPEEIRAQDRQEWVLNKFGIALNQTESET